MRCKIHEACLGSSAISIPGQVALFSAPTFAGSEQQISHTTNHQSHKAYKMALKASEHDRVGAQTSLSLLLQVSARRKPLIIHIPGEKPLSRCQIVRLSPILITFGLIEVEAFDLSRP